MAFTQVGSIVAAWLLERWLYPHQRSATGWPLPRPLIIRAGLLLLAGWLGVQAVLLLLAALMVLIWPSLQTDEWLLLISALCLVLAMLAWAFSGYKSMPAPSHPKAMPATLADAFMRGWHGQRSGKA